MKKVVSVCFALVFAVLFAGLASAQIPSGKVGLIDIFALGAKGGLTKYVNGLEQLNREFAAQVKELQTMAGSIKTRAAAYEKLRVDASKPGSPIKIETVREKAAELDQARRDAKFKQEGLQAKISARRQTVIGPIWNDIRGALKKYAQQKGYAVILDGAKLEESGIMMAFDNKYNVTKDFIAFYNSGAGGGKKTD